MGHYRSEMVDDLAGYYPSEDEMPTVSYENLRYNIARARKAEEELARLTSGLNDFRRLIGARIA